MSHTAKNLSISCKFSK